MADILKDITVADFSQLVAGPSAAMLLADMGAKVVKVESLEGDQARHTGRTRWQGHSPAFLAYNSNKRSLAVDLKRPEGREVVARLLRSCDVVIEGFRPGVMDRLGLGYEAVRQSNPGLIFASVTGFGSTGPDSKRPGVDLIIQGESGIMSVTGEPDREPMKVGFTVVDAATGLALANSVLAALIGRMKGGGGIRIEVSLMDVALHLQAAPLTDFLISGEPPMRTGNAAPLGAPAGLYLASDGPMIISAYFPDQWKALCSVIDAPDLTEDPRFASNVDRLTNRTELDLVLNQVFARRTRSEWTDAFSDSRIIIGEVKEYPAVAASPQVRANRALVGVTDRFGRTFRTPAPPRGLQTQSSTPMKAAPTLGANSREILAELGYRAVEIEEMVGDRIIGAEPASD